MKPKQHAEVWEAVTAKLWATHQQNAGDTARQLWVMAVFASMVAEAYRESDNARG